MLSPSPNARHRAIVIVMLAADRGTRRSGERGIWLADSDRHPLSPPFVGDWCHEDCGTLAIDAAAPEGHANAEESFLRT